MQTGPEDSVSSKSLIGSGANSEELQEKIADLFSTSTNVHDPDKKSFLLVL